MSHRRIFLLCALSGAAVVAYFAAENILLALFMGAVLGASVAVMILAFPLDLSYREPIRGKREVHVVMVDRSSTKR